MYIFQKTRLKFLWMAISVAFTCLILASSTNYFLPGPTPNFLVQKGELRFQTLWRCAFNCHVIASCACLAVGPFLMIPRLVRFKRLHILLGYVYFNAILWIAAPTGLIISPAANGGWLSATGFFVTGVLWWITTWLGYSEIRKGNLPSHICWMVRSYSIALSAIWFRILQTAFDVAGSDPINGYILSVWGSLLISFWFSETCVARHYPGELLPLRFSIFSYLAKGKMT